MKQKFTVLRSRCVPLGRDNVDTDQLIPARYLKATSRDEAFFGAHLFHDWRYDEKGSPRPDFVLNDPRFGGEVLLGGANFGCGSSREHAAWALGGYGFRAVVASSFADIHRNNELNNFVLPVEVTPQFLQMLLSAVRNNPQECVEIDLARQRITRMLTGDSESFPVSSYKRHCFMQGLDDMDYLLSQQDRVVEWERKHKIAWIDEVTK